MNTSSISKQSSLTRFLPTGSAGILFFIQMFSTLGFAVLYSSLVLYTTKRLNFSEADADAIMGVFGAFNYGLHLFGGYLGGRYLSNRNLFILGMILQVIGCYSIACLGVPGLYWGLAMFLTGSGLNVTCLNMMLTQRFKPEDNQRERAFMWNYAGMNIGFFIGFSVAGYFQLQLNYYALFIFATLGNVVAIIITLVYWKKLKDITTSLVTEVNKFAFYSRMAIGIIILVVLIPVIYLLLDNAAFTGYFVITLGIVMFIFLCILTIKHHPHTEKTKMLAYLILMIGSLVFWSLYQLAPTGLMLFTVHNVNLLFCGYNIAPQWTQNINTIVIVIGGPLLAYLFDKLRYKGYCIDVPLQFSCSLFFIGLGMLILPLGIKLANSHGMVDFQWLLISYILQSIGELLIAPVGYAMIGRLIPGRYQGMMMGCWMMVTGVASVISSDVAKLMPQNEGSLPALTNPSYSTTFSYLGYSAIIMGIILFLLIPKLRNLIDKKSDITAKNI